MSIKDKSNVLEIIMPYSPFHYSRWILLKADAIRLVGKAQAASVNTQRSVLVCYVKVETAMAILQDTGCTREIGV